MAGLRLVRADDAPRTHEIQLGRGTMHVPGLGLPDRPTRGGSIRRAGFKWKPRSGVWARTNNDWDPASEVATSYGWWQYAARIGGLLVFNSYRYSVSTSKHQSQMRSLLSQLGVRIDIFVETRKSLLEGVAALISARETWVRRIASLEADIAKPRTHAARNQERRDEIRTLQARITELDALLAQARRREGDAT